jgi:hypothetical protein
VVRSSTPLLRVAENRARRSTANPLRNAAASVRYDVGLLVAHALRGREESWPRLAAWAGASEGAQNCIADPWLGKAVRLGNRLERLGRRMLALGDEIRDTKPGHARDRLRARYERVGNRAVAVSLAQARHRLLAYPDDFASRSVLEMHERA